MKTSLMCASAVPIVLLVAGAAAVPAQRPITASGIVSAVEHRVSAGGGVERSSGGMFGVGVETRALGRVQMRLELLSGGVSPDTVGAEDRRIGEIAASASISARPWLAFHLGTSVRRYSSDLASQRWVALRTGAEARTSVFGGSVTALLRASVIPIVSVTGLERPDLAVATAAGLEFQSGRIRADIMYALERYDFPVVNETKRLEQLSALKVRVGWKFDR